MVAAARYYSTFQVNTRAARPPKHAATRPTKTALSLGDSSQTDAPCSTRLTSARARAVGARVVRREPQLAAVPHIGRPRLRLGRDAHLVHVVPLLTSDVEAPAWWVVSDAIQHEAVRRPPRADLLGEQAAHVDPAEHLARGGVDAHDALRGLALIHRVDVTPQLALDPLELVDAVHALPRCAAEARVDDRHAPLHLVRLRVDVEELVPRVGHVQPHAVRGEAPPLRPDDLVQ
mmetsp:Transcript_1404/g.3144  ORF Transcript_1404/g.3144 Transcript_1404/m.3144 type:complete len:232 (+) Transcript_1404:127-822(+)